MSERKEIRVGTLPTAFLRWGRVIIVFVFVVMLAILLGLRTTKVIKGNITITSVVEPHDLYARTAGTFQAEAEDGRRVEKGALIGYIEGNFNPDRIMDLRRWLGTLSVDNILETPGMIADSSVRFEQLQSGPLLDAFTNFISAADELQQINTVEHQNVRTKQALLDRQIAILNEKLKVARRSDSLLQRRSNLQDEVIQRSESLLDDSVIAQSELDREYLDQLESDYEYIFNQTELPEIKSQREALRSQRTQTQYQHEVRKKKYERTVRMHFRELQQILEDWTYERIIRAPVSGECVLSKLEPRYEVVPGEVVATILPSDSSRLVGRFKAPPQGISKIEIGAPVRVKLEAYPYLEYGAVFGEVQSISKIPFEGQYNVKVAFPEGLTTNYDYTLEFSQTLEGSCEVILEKSNMFEKILQVLRWQKKVY